jgi:hypothetical protein
MVRYRSYDDNEIERTFPHRAPRAAYIPAASPFAMHAKSRQNDQTLNFDPNAPYLLPAYLLYPESGTPLAHWRSGARRFCACADDQTADGPSVRMELFRSSALSRIRHTTRTQQQSASSFQNRSEAVSTSGLPTIRPEVIAGCSTLSSNVRLKPQQELILLWNL